MGVVNRTDDSFFAGNRHADLDAAMRALHVAVDEGADIVDVGGVRAGQEGAPVSVAEEIDRVVPFLERARAAYPDLILSLDTWRAEVAARGCADGDRPRQRPVGRRTTPSWSGLRRSWEPA
jgi:dihydropteroate synthase